MLVGPASADEAHAVLRDVAGVLADWCTTQTNVDVVVDCGRIGPAAPTVEMLVRADAAMVLTRPSLDQLRPAAHRLTALKASGVEASLLLVGDKPYGPDEVAPTLKTDVGGVIAWDPRTAAVLTGEKGAVRDLRRSPLVRSTATLTDRLASSLSESSRSDGTASTPPVGEVEVAKEARR